MAGSKWQSADFPQCTRTTWVSSDVETRRERKVIRYSTLSTLLKCNTKTIRYDARDRFHYGQISSLLIRYQVLAQNISQRAGAALLDRIGAAIIVTHSRGGSLGFLIADARPLLVKALISLEPLGPPFEDIIVTNNTAARPYGLTTIPITYDPPVVNPAVDLPRVTIPPAGPNLSQCLLQASPPRKLSKLVGIPQLVVTTEASYHAVYDYCTVLYLRQAGVGVDFLNLPQAGIHGNAHLLFLEKNNLDIAAKVEGWIRSKVAT